jgi:hypothetical protein
LFQRGGAFRAKPNEDGTINLPESRAIIALFVALWLFRPRRSSAKWIVCALVEGLSPAMRLSKIASLLALIVIGGASVARAQDVASPFGQLLPPEATYRLNSPFEARLGGFAHDSGAIEKGSGDVSAEVIFGNISLNTDPWWRFVTMRAHIGGTYNTAGKTDGIYAGPIWTAAIYDKVFVEASIDAAFNDGMTGPVKPLGRAGMGCHDGFHESVSIGYDVTAHWTVMATAEHYSNQNLCQLNHGINNFGVKIGYSF